VLSVWILVLGCCASCGITRWGQTRPNVVLIVVDDLRADHLTTYRYPRDTAPFVDELARRGVVFDNVISQSSWTKTSMASMLSSLDPDAHGVRRTTDVLSNDVVLLPELLRAAGYRTLCVHGNPWMAPKFGFNQGYDYFVYSHWQNEDMSGRRVTREGIQWLGAKPAEPFFLYLHFMDVHAPFEVPDGFDVFGDTPEDAYDDSILYVDAQLRELYSKLDALGVLDETWFVFTADHGEEFRVEGTHVAGHGATLYEQVLHVPLVFHRRNRTERATRLARQVRLIDVAPTILDLAGIAPPETMRGVSLKANLEGDDAGADLVAISRVGGNDVAPDKDLFSFSTAKFKYILDLAHGTEELYDRAADPLETRNVAEQNPDVVARFRKQALVDRAKEQATHGASETLPEIDGGLREQLRALGYLK
jgi:arylsulfatase A-like enzyme